MQTAPFSPPSASRNSSLSLTARFGDDAPIVALLLGIILLMGEEVHLFLSVRFICVVIGTLILAFSAVFFFKKPTRLSDPRLLVAYPLLLLVLLSIATLGKAEFRAPAIADLLRLIAGVAGFVLCAFGVKSQRLPGVALSLIGLAVLVGGGDLAHIGGAGSSVEGGKVGFYATHEEVGTLLLLVWPIGMAIALVPHVAERWRLIGFVVTFFLSVALIVERCRSAWLGGILAAVVLVILLVLRARQTASALPKRAAPQKRKPSGTTQIFDTPLPYILIAGLLIPVVLWRVGNLERVKERFSSLNLLLVDADKNSPSIADRFIRWEAATRMVAERPLWGWGPGSYAPLQSRWTHRGLDTVLALTQGTDHRNIAHNFYLQIAAETGGVGLVLNSAALIFVIVIATRGSFLIVSNKERGIVEYEKDALRTAIAMGVGASVCGAAIDAIASPSYQFPALFALLWAIAGLGVAVVSSEREGVDQGEAVDTVPATSWIPGIVLGVIVGCALAGGIITYGRNQIKQGDKVARGSFLLESPVTEIAPGEPIIIAARFKDANGSPYWTDPGTMWGVASDDPDFLKEAQLSLQGVTLTDGTRIATLTLRGPMTTAPITISARYRDSYSRLYDAQKIITVRPRPALPPVNVKN